MQDIGPGDRDTNGKFHAMMGSIKESNTMGKNRDIFKKIRDTKGTFHGKMGTKKRVEMART